MSHIVINILDIIKNSGEAIIQEALSVFSCPINQEIESFAQNKAIDFAKRKLSITYLVFDISDSQIIGFFTLAHKAIDISGENLSNTIRKKLNNHSRYDNDTDVYSTSAFLLAQFGKNYAVDKGTRITGCELMDCAIQILFDIQHRIGGGIVYLDAEDRPSLIDFYEKKVKFKRFGERFSATDNTKYLQYMRFL